MTLKAMSAETKSASAITRTITMQPCSGSRYVNIFEDGKRVFSGDSKLVRFILDHEEQCLEALDSIEDAISESAERGKAIEHLLKEAGLDKRTNVDAFRKAKQQLMGKSKPVAAVNMEYVTEYAAKFKSLKLN